MDTILYRCISKMSFFGENREEQERRRDKELIQHIFPHLHSRWAEWEVKELYNRWVVPAVALRSLSWRCWSRAQHRRHLLQTRKSDISGFQPCYNCNMFSFKRMILPSSFMQFYFKLKGIITITLRGKNFTITFEVAEQTTGCCKPKAEKNHCFRVSVNWFFTPDF